MNTHEAIEALRLKAFETNALSDRHAYYTTLSKAFQNGELVVRSTLPIAGEGNEAIAQLHAIVDAWEALPGGRWVRNSDVEEWLAKDLAPAINAIRGFLRRPKPDGTVPLAPHGDDIAVARFSAAMKAKLAKKRDEGRGGWEDKSQCSNEFLSQLLREHVDKGDPVDVGNLAMMLQQRGERISSPGKDGGQEVDLRRPLQMCVDMLKSNGFGVASMVEVAERALAASTQPASTSLVERLTKALSAVNTWAEQRCPCRNEEPNPCPLCGADANKSGDICLSAENTFPRYLLTLIRDALSSARKDGHNANS